MVARGWYVQPQLSFGGDGRRRIHLSRERRRRWPHVDEFTAALAESVAAARPAGPVAVDPGVVAFIESLDPAALTDDDFDGLLAASGLVGASADGELELPTRMAEVNAMLDVASPAMREALLSPSSTGCPAGRRMSALAGLVERGLVAPDWAEALAPVDDQIAAMGEFLREELAAGRGYLPAGDHVLRAFQRPLADVRVLVVGQDPYPTPGHPIGLSFAVAPDVRPVPREPGQHLRRAGRPTSGIEPLAHGDLTAWADQGVMLLNRVLTVAPGRGRVAPRTRLGGRHRAGDRRRWPRRGGPCAAILWGRDAQSLKPMLGPVPWVESVHPSPLSASRGFFGSRPFSRVNRLLEEQGGDAGGLAAAARLKIVREFQLILGDMTRPHARPLHRPRRPAAARRPGLVRAARRPGPATCRARRRS